MIKKQTLIIAVVLSLAACKTAEESLKEAGNKPLNSAQVTQTVTGNTLVGTSYRTGNGFKSYYNKNGTVKIVIDNGRKDAGTWKIGKGGTLCTKYSWIRKGAEYCRRIYKVGKEYQSVQLDGAEGSKYRVVKGNPSKL